MRRVTLARRRNTARPASPSLAGDLAGLGPNLIEQARWSVVEPFLRECLSICDEAMPNDWRRFDVMSRLGGALTGLRRFAEAERLVLPGYEGMKARETGLPAAGKSALFAASRRVVRVYESWGKPEQATAWQRKRGLSDLPVNVFGDPR